jgi:ankyrin repeat protein
MPITTPRVQHPAHPKVATPLPHTDFGSPADSDTLIGFGFTPENAAIARTLLAAGADPLLTDDTHIGPLVLALEEDKEETARLLIAYGADVNVPDHDGWTPLMYAIRNAGPKADPSVITEMLFERGVRVNDVAKDGETALELAEYQKDSLLIAKLKALGAVSHGAPTDRIHGTVPPD